MSRSIGKDERPSRPATIDGLAEWEARSYAKLRAARVTPTPISDILPLEPIEDPAAARAALRQLG